MPIELTEEMIDAPREFLLLYNGKQGQLRTEEARRHLELSGVNFSCWPDWAKEGDTGITKAGAAILIWTMMMSAAGHQPDPAVAAIQFALGMDYLEDAHNFLSMWNEGLFPEIRRQFPTAPDAVFEGADPLFKKEEA